MPGMQERSWALHEDEWDTADGGASRARAKQASASLQRDLVVHSTRTPTSEGEHTFHRWQFQKGTPSTEATSPEFTGEAIPETYLKVIGDAFGTRADLHSEVLGISRNAIPREIRIAYFRRGREVLSERPSSIFASPQSASISGAVTDVVKLRFQAVSMAYEVVSNPAWFESYEKYRARFHENNNDDDDDETDVLSTPSKPRSVASMSALRRVSSTGSLKSASKSVTGVRWNEEVEELVFNQDPEEVSYKSERKQKDASKKSDKSRDKKKKEKKKKKKKKSKNRITVEVENLEQHLEQLDKQAEKDFVEDFLDDLERSVDEFFNFRGDSVDSLNDEDYEDDEYEEEELVMTGKKLFPELEANPVPADARQETFIAQKRRSSHRPKDIDADRELEENRATLKFDTDHAMETIPPNMHHFVDQDGRPVEAYQKDSRQESPDEEPFDSPIFSPPSSREQAQPPGRAPPTLEDPWSGGANMNPTNMNLEEKRKLSLEEARAGPQRQKPPLGTRQANRSISPLGNPVPRHVAKQTSPPPRFAAPKNIQVMKTFEKRSFDDGESAAFTVDDTVSTLSASVVQRHVNRDLTNSRYQAEPEVKLDTTFNLGEAVVPDLRASLAPQTPKRNSQLNWSPKPDTEAALSSGENSEVNNVLFCENLCGDGDAGLLNSPGVLTTNQSRGEPDFTVYLMAYMREINKDLKWLGESIQNGIQIGSFLEAVTVSEDDLDGMLGILETELEELPEDYSLIRNEFVRGRTNNV